MFTDRQRRKKQEQEQQRKDNPEGKSPQHAAL